MKNATEVERATEPTPRGSSLAEELNSPPKTVSDDQLNLGPRTSSLIFAKPQLDETGDRRSSDPLPRASKQLTPIRGEATENGEIGEKSPSWKSVARRATWDTTCPGGEATENSSPKNRARHNSSTSGKSSVFLKGSRQRRLQHSSKRSKRNSFLSRQGEPSDYYTIHSSNAPTLPSERPRSNRTLPTIDSEVTLDRYPTLPPTSSPQYRDTMRSLPTIKSDETLSEEYPNRRITLDPLELPSVPSGTPPHQLRVHPNTALAIDLSPIAHTIEHHSLTSSNRCSEKEDSQPFVRPISMHSTEQKPWRDEPYLRPAKSRPTHIDSVSSLGLNGKSPMSTFMSPNSASHRSRSKARSQQRSYVQVQPWKNFRGRLEKGSLVDVLSDQDRVTPSSFWWFTAKVLSVEKKKGIAVMYKGHGEVCRERIAFKSHRLAPAGTRALEGRPTFFTAHLNEPEDGVIHSGVLWRRHWNLWDPRHVEVTESALTFYQSTEHMESPKESVSWSNVVSLARMSYFREKWAFKVSLRNGKNVAVKCDSEEELNTWIVCCSGVWRGFWDPEGAIGAESSVPKVQQNVRSWNWGAPSNHQEPRQERSRSLFSRLWRRKGRT